MKMNETDHVLSTLDTKTNESLAGFSSNIRHFLKFTIAEIIGNFSKQKS